MSETMPIEAVELLGACMVQNANDAAWIQDQLRQGIERDRAKMSDAFITLYDALAEIPDTSRSVYIDDLLADLSRWRTNAERWSVAE